MAPKAQLGDNLIDDLVPVVDDVRDSIFTDVGNRPWRVFLIRRQWSGTEVGDGDPTVISKTEVRPQPKVIDPTLKMELVPTALVESGDIELHEVSLTFSEPELQPRDLLPTQEFYYRLVAALGQKQVTRQYVPSKPPEADREQEIGWVVALKRVQVKE